MKQKKTYRVYVPVEHSEVYDVWASSKKEAIEMVKNGKAQCLGEWTTGHKIVTAVKVKENLEKR